MTFESYVKLLNEYLGKYPETSRLEVVISNGWCTSEDIVKVYHEPHVRNYKTRADYREKRPGKDVLFLK